MKNVSERETGIAWGWGVLLHDCNDTDWICPWRCSSLQRCVFGGPNFWDIVSLKQTDRARYSDKKTQKTHPWTALVDVTNIAGVGGVRRGVILCWALVYYVLGVSYNKWRETVFSQGFLASPHRAWLIVIVVYFYVASWNTKVQER